MISNSKYGNAKKQELNFLEILEKWTSKVDKCPEENTSGLTKNVCIEEINKKLMPLHDALFCETSPGPLKYAASLLGICSSDARLPIVEIEEDSKLKVKNALKQTGII